MNDFTKSKIAKKKVFLNPEVEDKSDSNKIWGIFFTVFIIMFLFFLFLANKFTPQIDVSIGDERLVQEVQVENSNIDSRLEDILMEDSGVMVNDDAIIDTSLDEIVVVPVRLKKKSKVDSLLERVEKKVKPIDESVVKLEQPVKENIIEEKPKEVVVNTSNIKEEQNIVEAPKVEIQSSKPVVAPVPSVVKPDFITNSTSNSYKVLVGYYPNKEQSEVAKTFLLDYSVDIQPFIKQVDNYYTIQAGSFSTEESANSMANELLRNNFPARVLSE